MLLLGTLNFARGQQITIIWQQLRHIEEISLPDWKLMNHGNLSKEYLIDFRKLLSFKVDWSQWDLTLTHYSMQDFEVPSTVDNTSMNPKCFIRIMYVLNEFLAGCCSH